MNQQKLIWNDYKISGFTPDQALFLTDLNERMNKFYFASHEYAPDLVETARLCNQWTQKFQQFLNELEPSKTENVWQLFFRQFYKDLRDEDSKVLGLLEHATQIPFGLFDEHTKSKRTLLNWWNEHSVMDKTLLHSKANEEEVTHVLSYRLLGKAMEEDFKKEVDNRISSVTVDDSLSDDLKDLIQRKLELTSLPILVIPGQVINKSSFYPKMMKKISQMQVHLDEATGWGMGAMSLKGRLAFMPGCLYSGAGGVCMYEQESEKNHVKIIVQTMARQPYLWLSPERELDFLLKAFTHEWIHAMDSLSQDVPNLRPLNDSLKELNESLDEINPNLLDRGKVFEHYRGQSIQCLSGLFEQNQQDIPYDLEDWVDAVLDSSEVNDAKLHDFLSKNSFITEIQWGEVSVMLAVAHKIKYEGWKEMPFIMRANEYDRLKQKKGQELYYSTPHERLAFSIENSLNLFNPMNTWDLMSVSEEESFELRKRWKKVFEKHSNEFGDLCYSYHMSPNEQSISKRTLIEKSELFFWKLQGFYRKFKETELNLIRSASLHLKHHTKNIKSKSMVNSKFNR